MATWLIVLVALNYVLLLSLAGFCWLLRSVLLDHEHSINFFERHTMLQDSEISRLGNELRTHAHNLPDPD